MFRAGERVVVLASSVPKGKIGAKRGSTGYVSESSIHGIEKRNDVTYALVRLHIVFSRYGYEEAPRCEEKTVFAIYPISRKSTTEQFKRTEELVKIMQAGKINSILTKRMVQNLPKGAVICVIGKSNNNIDLCAQSNIEETICWLDSMFKNETRWEAHILHNFVNSSRVKRPKNINTDLINTLINVAYNRDIRHTYYTKLRAAKSEHLDKVINSMRQIHILAMKRNDTLFMDRIDKHFSESNLEGVSTDGILHSEVFGQLVDCCDNPYMYLALINAIKSNLYLNKYGLFELITENIKIAPQHMNEMAETVELKNN